MIVYMMINSYYLLCRKLAVSQFEPFYARTAFPCFDEPNFKSIFIIRLVYSKKFLYHAQSNMPIVVS